MRENQCFAGLAAVLDQRREEIGPNLCASRPAAEIVSISGDSRSAPKKVKVSIRSDPPTCRAYRHGFDGSIR
jgi:hypothetical protein